MKFSKKIIFLQVALGVVVLGSVLSFYLAKLPWATAKIPMFISLGLIMFLNAYQTYKSEIQNAAISALISVVVGAYLIFTAFN